MSKKSIFLIACVLLIAAPVAGQGTIDKYGNFHPTEEASARNKRIGELLQHPTFVLLRLASQKRHGIKEEPSTTPSPYTADEWIHFELFLTQNSSEEITLTESWSPYATYRPELIHDGDPVPYSTAPVGAPLNEFPRAVVGLNRTAACGGCTATIGCAR